MPSFSHEGFIDLFRQRPNLAAELLTRSLHVELPSFSHAETTEADFTQLVPTEFRSDLVILLKDGQPVFGIVVEVQLRVVNRKRFTWPTYATVLRARHEVPVVVLVFTPDAAVAEWARQPVDIGPERVWSPHVIGPSGVPKITDPIEARAAPELAIMAAIAHGDAPDGRATLEAALSALAHVDDEHGMVYYDLVMAALSETAQQELQDMARSGNYEFASDFAKKYVDQGKSEGLAEGRAEGEAKGRAASLIQVLELRGFMVDEPLRHRIVQATVEQLEAWLAKAMTASAIADVFQDG